MAQGEAVYVQAYCPACDSPRYRSTKPLIIGKDKLDPACFTALDPEGPPPAEGVPTCHVCQGALRFVKEPGTVTPIRERHQVTAAREEAPAIPRPPAVQDTSSAVRELFRVNPDEKLLELRQGRENSIIIITNQRIVEVTI